MKLGDIVIVYFPYTNLRDNKIRPAVVVTATDDTHQDCLLCLISSNVPSTLGKREILLQPNETNKLKVPSVIKVYRVATLETSRIISVLGRLSETEIQQLITAFQSLPLS